MLNVAQTSDDYGGVISDVEATILSVEEAAEVPRQDGFSVVLCLDSYDGGRPKEHTILGIVMVEWSLP
jgi:hypothetical protein